MAEPKHFGSELPKINGRSLDLKYIWNVNGLVRELREGTLESEKRFAYLLWIFLVGLIGLYLFPQEPFQNLAEVAESLVMDTMSVLALVLCYQTNLKGDNREFIERFVCLFLPTAIRTGVMVMPVMMAILLLPEWFPSLEMKPGNWVSYVFNVCITAVWAWQLRAAFAAVSRVEPEQAVS